MPLQLNHQVKQLEMDLPGVNFTNILYAAFSHADPKSAKKTLMT